MQVAGIDLAQIEIIDAHMHVLRRATLSEAYSRQAETFTKQVMPPVEDAQSAALHSRIAAGFTESVHWAPRKIGYINYVARVYGVPATIAGFDSVVAKHLGSDADYTRYTRSVLDREKIASVVLESTEREPITPTALIPENRWVWTFPIVPIVRPAWAKEKGASTFTDLLAAIDTTLETAVNNGCVGFKTFAAKYRTLGLTRVSRADAERAFDLVRSGVQVGIGEQKLPIYADEAVNVALRTCEDFLYRHIFTKAGALDRPVIIHSAVALSPYLRVDYNDPQELYELFREEAIQRAGTRFLIVHAGYPSHHVLAVLASQFPNVYVDTSFFSKYPAVLEEIYRVFLGIAPSSKLMHGSDANTIPEELGYCAWNGRTILAKVLTDYVSHYGWTATDVQKMAEDVLHRNARSFFGIAG
jgi:predicted TIM-barrel fold metal-dependent hydrolase